MSRARGGVGATRVGITTGRCFCGPIGLSGVRQEFSLVGDAVNLAARLMAKCAPNETRCDLATREAAMAQAGWAFEECAPYVPKGKNEPVRSFRPRWNGYQPRGGGGGAGGAADGGAPLGARAPPLGACLLYTSPSPRDGLLSRMPSSA